MVPEGFSVMILYLGQDRTGQGTGSGQPQRHCSTPQQLLHNFLVPARTLEGPEGEAAGGSVVEGHSDAPQVHGGAVLLLVVLPEDGALVHVRVLQEDHTQVR